jgi:hypothetical protein
VPEAIGVRRVPPHVREAALHRALFCASFLEVEWSLGISRFDVTGS